MLKIGIFWIYQGAIFGKEVPISDAEKGFSGILDSPDTHIKQWKSIIEGTNGFPELKYFEYEEVPRGRVVYDAINDRPIVYMDAVLHRKLERSLIREFFGLGRNKAVWMIDEHYVTDRLDIEILFDK